MKAQLFSGICKDPIVAMVFGAGCLFIATAHCVYKLNSANELSAVGMIPYEGKEPK